MNHLHTYINLEKNGLIQVSLDIPANVYLMADKEYKNYLAGKEYISLGGLVKSGLKKIKAPAAGNWHLVIDNNDKGESVNVALQVINGQTINEEWDRRTKKPAASQKTAPPRQQPAESAPALSREELAAQKKELLKDLTRMIKQIDTEGLLFLMKQASVLIHNQQVENLNQKITEYNMTLTAHQQATDKKGKKGAAPAAPVLVDLQENTPSSFILVLKGVRKVLSRHELREILKICHTGGPNRLQNLYNWLKIKRTDILFDTGIRSSSHPLIPALHSYLVSRYKAKE